MSDILQRIRDLQFTQREEAERLLFSFLREQLSLPVSVVQLTPKPTSLNSFNGIVTMEDGSQKFFKTHTESHTIIQEYYNAGMLAEAGYPIVLPTFQSTELSKQILMYEVIQDESVFDVAWKIEQSDSTQFVALQEAQEKEDKTLLHRYLQSLKQISNTQNATAPIHQLFYHRLVGGRLAQFYCDKIMLPNGIMTIADCFNRTWIINGQRYSDTIQAIIEKAITLLNPRQAVPAITGHGDAHNGNVFLQRPSNTLLYFDPAFAGQHHPLLDLVKPLFHNVFAMWMYFPLEKHHSTVIDMAISKDEIVVNYDYDLPPIRQMFLESKIDHVLIPILRHLKESNQLQSDWRSFIKVALFCCPFLTMNLCDRTRFSPEIGLLGLAMSVEMGANSLGKKSVIDQQLERVANIL